MSGWRFGFLGGVGLELGPEGRGRGFSIGFGGWVMRRWTGVRLRELRGWGMARFVWAGAGMDRWVMGARGRGFRGLG